LRTAKTRYRFLIAADMVGWDLSAEQGGLHAERSDQHAPASLRNGRARGGFFASSACVYNAEKKVDPKCRR
jgi:hypothetical protein